MAWYNSLWRYRKKLTIPAANVAGTGALSAFPLVFNPASDADILANARSDGWDILFTSSDGTTKIPHEILPKNQFAARAGMWGFFTRPQAVYYSGKSHYGSVTPAGVQQVTQFVHATGVLTTTTLNTHTTTPDDHCNPSLLVRSSDNKVLAFFPESHNGTLSMRVSSSANDSTAFAAESAIDPGGSGRYAYPCPHQLTSKIALVYRDRVLTGPDRESWAFVTSSDNGATWGSGTLINSTASGGWGTRPYCVTYSNGSRVDFLFSTDSPDLVSTDEYKILHCYYDGTTFRRSDGTDMGAAPYDVADMTEVYDGTAGTDSTWPCDIKYKENGSPHCLFYVYDGDVETNHDLYYGYYSAGTWTTEKVMDEGDGFASSAVRYPGVAALDPADEDILWASKEESSVYQIQKWSRATGAWAKVHDVTTDTTTHHIRPVVVKDSPAGSLGRVAWSIPTTYTTYNNFVGAAQVFPAFGTNFDQAWIKADIHGNTDTDIYVYWGNPNAADQQNRTDTSSDFYRVYHAREQFGAPSGTYHDASGKGAALTHNRSSEGTAVSAVIGNSFAFNGTSDRIQLASVNFAGWTGFHCEMYAKYTSGGTDEHELIGSTIDGTTAQFNIRLEPTNDTVEMFCTTDTNQAKGGTVSTIAVVADTWAYIAGGWTPAGGIYGRVNKTAGTVASSTGTAFDATASGAHYLGARSNSTDWLNGNIAEFRILENASRSQDFTDTQVDNWEDGNAFFTIAALEDVDLIDLTAISAFNIFTALLTSASNIGSLTETATASDYDWSGMGLKADRSGSLSVGALAACTLITDRHGVSAWHAGPNVNDVVYFRSPDGTERTATVQAITRMGTSDIRLVRFTSAPHASLARYPIITNGEELIGEGFWTPQHTSVIAYREITSFGSDRMNHQDGGWGIAETSSGRPSMVPLDSGSFGILGTAWHTSDHAWLEPQINNINSALSAYSETVGELDATGLATPDEPIVPDPLHVVDLTSVKDACVNLQIVKLTCIG